MQFLHQFLFFLRSRSATNGHLLLAHLLIEIRNAHRRKVIQCGCTDCAPLQSDSIAMQYVAPIVRFANLQPIDLLISSPGPCQHATACYIALCKAYCCKSSLVLNALPFGDLYLLFLKTFRSLCKMTTGQAKKKTAPRSLHFICGSFKLQFAPCLARAIYQPDSFYTPELSIHDFILDHFDPPDELDCPAWTTLYVALRGKKSRCAPRLDFWWRLWAACLLVSCLPNTSSAACCGDDIQANTITQPNTISVGL